MNNEETAEKITKGVENLFGKRVSDEGDMWGTFSQFAAQFDEQQILGITYLTYIKESMPKNSSLAMQIDAVIKEYKTLCNNRGTLMAMIRMGEVSALKEYFRGIEGKVRVSK